MKLKFRKRVARFFGRRGGILTLFGFVWMLLGYGFESSGVERFSRPGPGGPLQFMDAPPLGLFWIACGLVALVNGLARRKLQNEDAVGYAALVMPPMLWSLAYLTSWVQWLVSHGHMANPYGRETSYLGFLVYLIIVIIVRIVANWTDDLDVPPKGPAVHSSELALMDRLVETHAENAARGNKARAASENWIVHARSNTERRIEESATENDRLIEVEKELRPPDDREQ